MNYKEILTMWSNDPYVTHEDTTKCGMCLREEIKSKVCKEILARGAEIGKEEFMEALETSKKIWQETELYQRVRGLLSMGLTLDEIDVKMREEGIEI